MIFDKDQHVAVAAIRAIRSIFRYLSDNDKSELFSLVFSKNGAVAKAAGQLLGDKVFVQKDSVVLRSGSGKLRSQFTPLLRLLITLFIESDVMIIGF